MPALLYDQNPATVTSDVNFVLLAREIVAVLGANLHGADASYVQTATVRVNGQPVTVNVDDFIASKHGITTLVLRKHTEGSPEFFVVRCSDEGEWKLDQIHYVVRLPRGLRELEYAVLDVSPDLLPRYRVALM